MMESSCLRVSRYAADVQVKYMGFLITEVKVKIEASERAPGEYGFGFVKDGSFVVIDVGANDLFRVPAKSDDNLRRPVPSRSCRRGKPTALICGKDVGFS